VLPLDASLTRLCTGGADGVAHVWQEGRDERSFSQVASFEHDGEQLYACELLGDGLLTAAGDCIKLWSLNAPSAPTEWRFLAHGGEEAARVFGGPRNPDACVYVFDAAPCPAAPHLLAAALSDATVRVLDMREGGPGVVMEVGGGHATSVAWSDDGRAVIVAGGKGQVSVWSASERKRVQQVQAHRRAAYGARFVDAAGTRCLSWSSDGSLALWDVGPSVPEAREAARLELGGFPVLAAAHHRDTGAVLIGGGGGGTASGFMGVPVHLAALSP